MTALCIEEEGTCLCLAEEALIELIDLRDDKLGLPCVGSFTLNEILAGLIDTCKWGYAVRHLDIECSLNRTKGG